MTEEELDMIIFQSHGKEEKALLQLRAERDALRADAERYRLLRSANVQCELFGNWTNDLDAALDAALRGEGEK